MFSRIRDRLKRLEAKIMPKGSTEMSRPRSTQTFRPLPNSLRCSRSTTPLARTTLSSR
jgi:hypothetical protein